MHTIFCVFHVFHIFYIASIFADGSTSKAYPYGIRMNYDNNEDIHSCADNEYETCTAQAIEELTSLHDSGSDFNTIAIKVQAISVRRDECLVDNVAQLNGCYLRVYTNYTSVMTNSSKSYIERNAYKEVVYAELRLCKKRMNKNCRTSSFVVDTIRSCVNDAILSFHRQVYPNVKGGQSAKTDVSNALVALQQSTIESKDGLVTGMAFIRNLDLLMDRLTFCSEQINHMEAVGI